MAQNNTHQTNIAPSQNVSQFVANNARVSSQSIFSDDVWDFIAEIPLPSVRDCSKIINFDELIKDKGVEKDDAYNFILTIKEFSYAKLHNPLPSYETVSALSVRNLIFAIKPLFLWCISKKLCSFNDITDAYLDEFNQFLVVQLDEKGKEYSSERIDRILKSINQLYEYKVKTTLPLNVSPIKTKRKTNHPKIYTVECRTPVIPEGIYKPLVRIAYYYIDVFSKDIINLLDKRDEIITSLERIEKNKGLTTFTISQKKYLYSFTELLNFTTIAINPDTTNPWRERFKTIKEFNKEVILLRNAAWTIIFALSGMRPSEFFSITSDSIVKVNVRDSDSEKFYLKGILYKNQKQPTNETWVVNEIVKLAVDVLIRLTVDMRKYSKTDKLILVTNNGILTGRNDPDNIAEFANSIIQPASSTVLYALNQFCTACHELYGESILLKDAKITARQFRRTLANHIAKEPFGVIAGKLQYKHVEVAMFEGYAGQDDSFLEELNEERAAASIDFMQEVIDDINNNDVYSPKSVQIINEFRGVATENRTPDYYLKNKRMMIYPGLLSYCFFSPEDALCLKDSKSKKEQPLLNSCSPDKCQNSCITKKHLPLWQAQIDDAKAMLNVKGVSDAQKHILIKEVKDLENAIAPVVAKEDINI